MAEKVYTKKIYDLLISKGGRGSDYETFASKMGDEDYRKSIYNHLTRLGGKGDYEEFNRKILDEFDQGSQVIQIDQEKAQQKQESANRLTSVWDNKEETEYTPFMPDIKDISVVSTPKVAQEAETDFNTWQEDMSEQIGTSIKGLGKIGTPKPATPKVDKSIQNAVRNDYAKREREVVAKYIVDNLDKYSPEDLQALPDDMKYEVSGYYLQNKQKIEKQQRDIAANMSIGIYEEGEIPEVKNADREEEMVEMWRSLIEPDVKSKIDDFDNKYKTYEVGRETTIINDTPVTEKTYTTQDGIKYDGENAQMINRAKKLNIEAKRLLESPTSFDDTLGIANFGRGVASGVANKALYAPIEKMARELNLGIIAKKMNEGKELTEPEQLLLDSYITYCQAQMTRAYDMSLGYQAGQSMVDSLQFMLEMVIAGGITGAATKGTGKILTKAGEKWLQKSLARTGYKAVESKAVASALTKAGNFITKIDDFGVLADGTKSWSGLMMDGTRATVGSFIDAALMPSTWLGVAEGYKEDMLDGDGNYTFGEGFSRFADAAVENVTEKAGGVIGGFFGKVGAGLGKTKLGKTGKITYRKLSTSKIGKMFEKAWDFKNTTLRPFNTIMQDPLSELLEEYFGGFINYGRSFVEEDRADEFRKSFEHMMTGEGFVETFAMTAPLSLLMGSANVAGMSRNIFNYSNAKKTLLNKLNKLGFTPNQARDLIMYLDRFDNVDNRKFASLEVKTLLDSLIRELNPDITTTEFKKASDEITSILAKYKNASEIYSRDIEALDKKYQKLSAEEKKQVDEFILTYTKEFVDKKREQAIRTAIEEKKDEEKLEAMGTVPAEKAIADVEEKTETADEVVVIPTSQGPVEYVKPKANKGNTQKVENGRIYLGKDEKGNSLYQTNYGAEDNNGLYVLKAGTKVVLSKDAKTGKLSERKLDAKKGEVDKLNQLIAAQNGFVFNTTTNQYESIEAEEAKANEEIKEQQAELEVKNEEKNDKAIEEAVKAEEEVAEKTEQTTPEPPHIEELDARAGLYLTQTDSHLSVSNQDGSSFVFTDKGKAEKLATSLEKNLDGEYTFTVQSHKKEGSILNYFTISGEKVEAETAPITNEKTENETEVAQGENNPTGSTEQGENESTGQPDKVETPTETQFIVMYKGQPHIVRSEVKDDGSIAPINNLVVVEGIEDGRVKQVRPTSLFVSEEGRLTPIKTYPPQKEKAKKGKIDYDDNADDIASILIEKYQERAGTAIKMEYEKYQEELEKAKGMDKLDKEIILEKIAEVAKIIEETLNVPVELTNNQTNQPVETAPKVVEQEPKVVETQEQIGKSSTENVKPQEEVGKSEEEIVESNDVVNEVVNEVSDEGNVVDEGVDMVNDEVNEVNDDVIEPSLNISLTEELTSDEIQKWVNVLASNNIVENERIANLINSLLERQDLTYADLVAIRNDIKNVIQESEDFYTQRNLTDKITSLNEYKASIKPYMDALDAIAPKMENKVEVAPSAKGEEVSEEDVDYKDLEYLGVLQRGSFKSKGKVTKNNSYVIARKGNDYYAIKKGTLQRINENDLLAMKGADTIDSALESLDKDFNLAVDDKGNLYYAKVLNEGNVHQIPLGHDGKSGNVSGAGKNKSNLFLYDTNEPLVKSEEQREQEKTDAVIDSLLEGKNVDDMSVEEKTEILNNYLEQKVWGDKFLANSFTEEVSGKAVVKSIEKNVQIAKALANRLGLSFDISVKDKTSAEEIKVLRNTYNLSPAVTNAINNKENLTEEEKKQVFDEYLEEKVWGDEILNSIDETSDKMAVKSDLNLRIKEAKRIADLLGVQFNITEVGTNAKSTAKSIKDGFIKKKKAYNTSAADKMIKDLGGRKKKAPKEEPKETPKVNISEEVQDVIDLVKGKKADDIIRPREVATLEQGIRLLNIDSELGNRFERFLNRKGITYGGLRDWIANNLKQGYEDGKQYAEEDVLKEELNKIQPAIDALYETIPASEDGVSRYELDEEVDGSLNSLQRDQLEKFADLLDTIIPNNRRLRIVSKKEIEQEIELMEDIILTQDNAKVLEQWIGGINIKIVPKDDWVHKGARGVFQGGENTILIKEGSPITTLLHELGWHATFKWAKENSPEMYAEMIAFAMSASQRIKSDVARQYKNETKRENGGEILIDEIGASLFAKTYRGQLHKALKTTEEYRWWQKLLNFFDKIFGKAKEDIFKNAPFDLNTIKQLDAISTMDRIATAMIRGQVLGKMGEPKKRYEGEQQNRYNAKGFEENSTSTNNGSEIIDSGTRYEKELTTEEAFDLLSPINKKQKAKTYPIRVEDRFELSKNTSRWVDAVLNKRKEVDTDFTDEDKERVMTYLHSLPKYGNDTINAEVMKCAALWYAHGSVALPEDIEKIVDIVKRAIKAKIDPKNYDNPNKLMELDIFKSKEPKVFISPDDVKTMRLVQELPNGFFIYELDNTEESRVNFRNLMNSQLGKDRNPWCLMQAEDGVLTPSSRYNWDYYNSTSYQAVFKLDDKGKKKLISFSANDQAERAYWSIIDTKHTGLPLRTKVESEGLMKDVTLEYSTETGESLGVVAEPNYSYGNRNNGEYLEWYDDGVTLKLKEVFSNGILLRTEYYDENGNPSEVEEYDEYGNFKQVINYEENGEYTITKPIDESGRYRYVTKHLPNGETEYRRYDAIFHDDINLFEVNIYVQNDGTIRLKDSDYDMDLQFFSDGTYQGEDFVYGHQSIVKELIEKISEVDKDVLETLKSWVGGYDTGKFIHNGDVIIKDNSWYFSSYDNYFEMSHDITEQIIDEILAEGIIDEEFAEIAKEQLRIGNMEFSTERDVRFELDENDDIYAILTAEGTSMFSANRYTKMSDLVTLMSNRGGYAEYMELSNPKEAYKNKASLIRHILNGYYKDVTDLSDDDIMNLTLDEVLNEIEIPSTPEEVSENIARREQSLSDQAALIGEARYGDMSKMQQILDNYYYAIADDALPIQRLLEGLNHWRKSKGLDPISTDLDVYNMRNFIASKVKEKMTSYEMKGEYYSMMQRINSLVKKMKGIEAFAEGKFQMEISRVKSRVFNEDKWMQYIIEYYMLAKDNIERGDKQRGKEEFKIAFDKTFEEYVEFFESQFTEDEINDLWDSIRGATKVTLDYLYNYQLIDETDYKEYLTRKYYVPQRGFEAEAFEEHIPYMSKSGAGNKRLNAKALKKAKGGESLAFSPLAEILNITSDTIRVALENEYKMAMYRLISSEENKDFFNEEISIVDGRVIKDGENKSKYAERNSRIKQKKKDASGNPIIQIVDGNEKYVYDDVDIEDEALIEEDKQLKEQINEATLFIDMLNSDLKDAYSELRKESKRKKLDADKLAEINQRIIDIKKDLANYRKQIKECRSKLNYDFSGIPEGNEYTYVKINGKLRAMRFADQRITDALNHIYGEDYKIKKLQKLNSLVAKAKTTYSPAFGFTNLFNDIQAVAFVGGSKYGAGFGARFAKNIVAKIGSVVDIAKYLYGGKVSNEFAEFMESGAMTGFYFSMNIDEYREQVEEFVKNLNRTTNFEKTKTTFKLPSELSEIYVRYVAFATARSMGYNAHNAATIAKNSSVNFDKRGAGNVYNNLFAGIVLRLMNNYAFGKASVRGIMTYIEALSLDKRPKAKKRMWGTLVGLTATSFALSLLNMFLNDGDDDDYDELIKLQNETITPTISSYDRNASYISWRDFSNKGNIFAKSFFPKRLPVTHTAIPFVALGKDLSRVVYNGYNRASVNNDNYNEILKNLTTDKQIENIYSKSFSEEQLIEIAKNKISKPTSALLFDVMGNFANNIATNSLPIPPALSETMVLAGQGTFGDKDWITAAKQTGISLTPTIGRPITELFVNVDYFGNNIYYENFNKRSNRSSEYSKFYATKDIWNQVAGIEDWEKSEYKLTSDGKIDSRWLFPEDAMQSVLHVAHGIMPPYIQELMETTDRKLGETMFGYIPREEAEKGNKEALKDLRDKMKEVKSDDSLTEEEKFYLLNMYNTKINYIENPAYYRRQDFAIKNQITTLNTAVEDILKDYKEAVINNPDDIEAIQRYEELEELHKGLLTANEASKKILEAYQKTDENKYKRELFTKDMRKVSTEDLIKKLGSQKTYDDLYEARIKVNMMLKDIVPALQLYGLSLPEGD